MDVSRMPRRRRMSLTLTAGAAALLLLTGCANPLEKAVEGLAERGVEKIMEAATGGGDVQIGGLTGSAEVPDDFPASVPLPGGTPNHSLRIVTDGRVAWTLHYAGTVQDYETIRADVVGSGFTEESSGELGDAMRMAQYTDGTYRLSVSLMGDDDDDRILQYLVVELSD